MKRFFAILALMLAVLTGEARAQKAIVYTTPEGVRTYYTAANATVDSTWAYLLANNTIAGVQVYTAVLLTARRVADLANGPYTGQVNFSRPASVLDPYKVASVISGATVAGGYVQLAAQLFRFQVDSVEAADTVHALMGTTLPGKIFIPIASVVTSLDTVGWLSTQQATVAFTSDFTNIFCTNFSRLPLGAARFTSNTVNGGFMPVPAASPVYCWIQPGSEAGATSYKIRVELIGYYQ
jgi:hypothetical protein